MLVFDAVAIAFNYTLPYVLEKAQQETKICSLKLVAKAIKQPRLRENIASAGGQPEEDM